MVSKIARPRSVHRIGKIAALAATVTVVAASTAFAHDFWIVPNMFAFKADATVVVNGRQGGGQFPAGTAVPVARVVDARIIGATTVTTISEMAVEGTSLKLQQKPAAAGQYLIVVGLSPRVNRQTPEGVIRYLKAEGGVAEAERLEREQPFAGMDSVIFTAASYAATIAQVGSGGPRAFGKTGGLRLEFVPLNDPGHVHAGDTLHVKLMGNGQPLPRMGLEVAVGLDSAAAEGSTIARVTYFTDGNGVAHVPLMSAGPVMMRSAFASPQAGGAKNEWDVSRTTYVFSVGAKH